MKKIIVAILTIAMLMSATAAFAKGGMNGGMQGGPQMQGGQMGNNNDQQTPPEKPSGEQGAGDQQINPIVLTCFPTIEF